MVTGTRALRVLADYVRLNIRYIASTANRATLRRALPPAMSRAALRQNGRERELADAAALPYQGLLSTSLALVGVVTGEAEPAVNILLGSARPDSLFAGVDTAITVGIGLATERGFSVRVVELDHSTTPDSELRSKALSVRYGSPIEVVPRNRISETLFGTQDVWLATHFLTAHALQVAVGSNRVVRKRCVYLIQDYEPGFVPWSTEFALARDTYHAGFLAMVNAIPVARYLRDHEGLEIPDERVFGPAFEVERLRAAAALRQKRQQGMPRTIFFYARPSKPRNMFNLGIAALRAAVTELGAEADGLVLVSLGEHHEPMPLGRGIVLRSLGKLDWDDYFGFLAGVDVALSLQHSPHPSHPPLEAAMAGAIAITNEFDGYRGSMHPRLIAVKPRVTDLARAVVDAVRSAAVDRSFSVPSSHQLGGTMADAVAAVWAGLDERERSSGLPR